MNDTATKGATETDAPTEQVADQPRLCRTCGKDGLEGRNTVHDDCLSTPRSRRLRERVRAAGHADAARKADRDAFDRKLATVTSGQLDVWIDRAADAHVSGGEGDQTPSGIRAHADAFVASIVTETIDDPKPPKARASRSKKTA